MADVGVSQNCGPLEAVPGRVPERIDILYLGVAELSIGAGQEGQPTRAAALGGCGCCLLMLLLSVGRELRKAPRGVSWAGRSMQSCGCHVWLESCAGTLTPLQYGLTVNLITKQVNPDVVYEGAGGLGEKAAAERKA